VAIPEFVQGGGGGVDGADVNAWWRGLDRDLQAMAQHVGAEGLEMIGGEMQRALRAARPALQSFTPRASGAMVRSVRVTRRQRLARGWVMARLGYPVGVLDRARERRLGRGLETYYARKEGALWGRSGRPYYYPIAVEYGIPSRPEYRVTAPLRSLWLTKREAWARALREAFGRAVDAAIQATPGARRGRWKRG